MTGSPIEIVAHRGYSARAPENTLAALDAALDAGAGSLEWDVQVAGCGTPVLFHDSTLDRTTNGSGALGARTLDELRELDAGGWFSADFRGERIPSFSEALSWVSGRASRIYPEIKAAARSSDPDRILGLVEDAGLLGRCTFLSLDHGILLGLRRLEPSVSVGYVVERAERMPLALDHAAGDPLALLAPDFRILLGDPGWSGRAREAEVPLAAWTVDRPETATRLLELGVRRMITNRVEELLRWAEERS